MYIALPLAPKPLAICYVLILAYSCKEMLYGYYQLKRQLYSITTPVAKVGEPPKSDLEREPKGGNSEFWKLHYGEFMIFSSTRRTIRRRIGQRDEWGVGGSWR